MGKLINIIIGLVIIAILAASGILGWSYLHPANDFVGAKIERDLQDWQDYVNNKPDDPLGRANLGAVYLEMGDTEKAIQELQTAVDLSPLPWGYTFRFELGRAYRQAGRYDDALDILLQAIQNYPPNERAPVAFEIAEVYMDKGDVAAAKDYAQQSIKMNDTIWNSHYLLGRILEQEGDLEGAKAQYEWAAKFSNDPALQEALARVS